MAGVLQHLRSSTLNKRPNPASMVDGQLAINYASGSPGAFFKDTNGNLVKVGPVHVGTTAPNVSPASGGTAGNSLGEQWLDTSGGTYVFKIWDGAAWRSEAGEFVNSTGDTMTGSLTMGPSVNLIFEGSTDDGFETTLTVVDPTADRTITLPNVSGTVVTTGDSGTVTSTMITDGTIVNADVNASAAIAGTKISPDFGSQTIQTTGVFSHAVGSAGAPIITFTGDTNTGIYSPGADQVAISTGGSGRLFVDANGNIGVGTASPQDKVSISGGGFSFSDTGGAARNISWKNLADNIAPVVIRGDAPNGALIFSTNTLGNTGTERLRIDSSGRLLVGTSSARTNFYNGANTAQIQLEGTNYQNAAFAIVCNANSDDKGSLILAKNRGTTVGSNTIVQDGDDLGSIEFQGSDGAEFVQAAAIKAEVDGTPGANDMPGRLVFSTTSDGASSPTPRMTIKSNGNVGIGTTSPGAIVHSTVSSAGVVFRGSHNNSGIDLYANDATGEARITATRLGGSGGKFLSFYTDTGTGEFERSRIDSSGRLLVGTSSALGGINSTVQIAGTNAAAGLQITRFNSTDGCVVDFSSNRNATVNNYTTSVNGDELVRLRFLGYDGANQQVAAQITAYVDGTPGVNDMPGRLVFSTTADGASSPTERARITSGGYFKASDNATYVGSTSNYHEFNQSSTPRCVIVKASNASYAEGALTVDVTRAANSAYKMFEAYSGSFGDREYELRGDGNAFADGTWTGGGADYAEYFEWADSNTDEEDRRGISVVLDGDKIREAIAGEDPIGVISGNPSVVGDAAWNKWNGKYLRDEFGTYILDENGDRQLNPAYDPDQPYQSREERPEWDCVGLMGKLRIRKGQVTSSRWIKMRDINDSVEEWLVR